MNASNEFSLRQIVRAVLDDTDLTEPHDIAVEVLNRIPTEYYRPVLRSLLPQYCRSVSDFDRSRKPSPRLPNPSTRVAGIAQWADDRRKRLLRNRFPVADGWKFLRDCTFDDLMTVAAKNRELAAGNIVAAEEAEKRAAAIQEHGVATFGDLPDDVIDELGGDE